MGTTIRPELSAKNRYYLPRHRFYELKHFCLQYPEWKRIYISLDGFSSVSGSIIEVSGNTEIADPTARFADLRLYYRDRMSMVENAAKEAGGDLYLPLLRAVTDGFSYDHLNAQDRIPCCKDVWYVLFRRFFWILDKRRK